MGHTEYDILFLKEGIMADSTFTKQADHWDTKDLSLQAFNKNYLKKNLPVVLKNYFIENPKLSKWNLDYLAEKLGDKIVRVNIATTTFLSVDPKQGSNGIKVEHMPFSQYIQLIKNQNNTLPIDNLSYFLQQKSIPDQFPELLTDLEISKYLSDKKIIETNLWIGQRDYISPLHFDKGNNLFMQIFGIKKFILYSPHDFYFLYPNRYNSKAPHLSPIQPLDVDIKKFPKFSKATPIEITLYPSDMLFIPAYWWHCVIAQDVTISINRWFNVLLRQKMVPGYFHCQFSILKGMPKSIKRK